jgi:hypothetical protein
VRHIILENYVGVVAALMPGDGVPNGINSSILYRGYHIIDHFDALTSVAGLMSACENTAHGIFHAF